MLWNRSFIILSLIILSLITLLFTCMPAIPSSAAAAVQNNVTLPTFSVMINGKAVDNHRLTYPFFVYKDITYVPLTFGITRTLGLQLKFDQGGLSIHKEHIQLNGLWADWRKEQYPLELAGSHSAKQKYRAALPAFAIQINDSSIDNGREPYPFLVWNGVTYMPLTWTYAHDKLGLALRWRGNDGLEIIGGQQQVLERIFYDDEQYLYVTPTFITNKEQGGLKVSKSMEEAPVWISAEEADGLRGRLQEEFKGYSGEEIELIERADGLYYNELKLLEKSDITVNPNDAGHPQIAELKGQLFRLGASRSYLSITKVVAYNVGQRMTTHYSYMLENDQARPMPQFPQPPDRVIPNADGSYWLVSNGMIMRKSTVIPGSRQVALVTAEGELRHVNDLMTGADVIVPGAYNPRIQSLLDAEGKLLIYMYHSWPRLEQETLPYSPGFYLVDTSLQLTRVEALDPLAAEIRTIPDDPGHWPFYRSVDGKLYLIRKNNDLANYSDNTSVLWYDHELLIHE
ncbi:hypothetical protein [Paenibacillus sp. YYML68]|uniref:hypothetical protein n=1 Tax=Paenibacillus sp. YYML68 TaxID=2909250 RepID=UPI00248F4767|nr:hypothetical protein [Paenibacillus sp. YYML68]